MASLLKSTETANLVSILGDVFDTFKREIIVHKSPKKVISQINESQLFGYGEAANPVNYTYTPQSGVYNAKISYIENKSNEYVQDFQSKIDNNIVRIKVEEATRDYIMNGKTEKVEFDNRYFNVISRDIVSSFLDVKYYIFYLKVTS